MLQGLTNREFEAGWREFRRWEESKSTSTPNRLVAFGLPATPTTVEDWLRGLRVVQQRRGPRCVDLLLHHLAQ